MRIGATKTLSLYIKIPCTILNKLSSSLTKNTTPGKQENPTKLYMTITKGSIIIRGKIPGEKPPLRN